MKTFKEIFTEAKMSSPKKGDVFYKILPKINQLAKLTITSVGVMGSSPNEIDYDLEVLKTDIGKVGSTGDGFMNLKNWFKQENKTIFDNIKSAEKALGK